MTNETAKVKLPVAITDYLAIPVRHTRSCSFNINGSGPESDFCDCGFDLRRAAKTRAHDELVTILNSHTALIEAARADLHDLQEMRSLADGLDYVEQAQRIEIQRLINLIDGRIHALRTALEKVGK